MKQRKLVIGLLVILAVAVSGFTFAFWASSITGNSVIATNTIQVGEGDEVTTTIALDTEVSSGLDLVPVGREVASESVSTITYTFDVEWAGASSAADAAGATGTLNITPVLSGAGASELALFTVTAASTQGVTYGSTTEVIITVTFTTEPANAAQYALIANAELTLTVTFLVNSVSAA
ncbi:MAG: hypothetical protein WC219_06280 [Acholeplasmataceae bacterium]